MAVADVIVGGMGGEPAKRVRDGACRRDKHDKDLREYALLFGLGIHGSYPKLR